MTCGACAPEAFGDALGVKTRGGRVFGYTSAPGPFSIVRRLYFHGAEYVIWDGPSNLRFLSRPAMALARRALFRDGDVLILAREADLGTRKTSQERNLDDLQDLGLTIHILKPPATTVTSF